MRTKAKKEVKPVEVKVQGVRIACSGELDIGVTRLKAYDVSLDHDVFHEGELCPVSKLIGMPLLISKVRPSLDYAATQDTYQYSLPETHHRNSLVAKLMICCDLGDGTIEHDIEINALCQTFERWKNAGSVIVVRQDRKELYPHHSKLLLKFIAFVTREVTIREISSGHEYTPKDAIKICTPGDWKDFYMTERRYWKQSPADMASVLSLPSPFKQPAVIVGRPLGGNLLKVWKYQQLSIDERLKSATNWKEKALLLELWFAKQAQRTP
ncbi:hypothetical protein LTR97_010603 [Elasticomyces elasticus]|uniref:Uncharacterized protein n=1 Tax=Elasticomyces elasticus TaxID=574655 RepID=A0AAN7VNM6_9PEZI|nr:hypothetical protein LTR97_010603 [Elasticomyces elasticus]